MFVHVLVRLLSQEANLLRVGKAVFRFSCEEQKEMQSSWLIQSMHETLVKIDLALHGFSAISVLECIAGYFLSKIITITL